MAVESDQVWRSRREAWATVGDDDPTTEIPEDSLDAEQREGGGRAPDGDDGGPFEPGRVLRGRYELERVVGRGGSCVVLAARDLRRHAAGDEQARVAIKALHPALRQDREHRRRLTAEFHQLQRLSHPDIVRVFDLDREGDDWFVVMELLEGVPLAGLIKHCEGGHVSAGKALAIVKACAGALGWAHGRGIVHGDVKPGNVFVTREDGVRLLDFGSASPEPAEGERAPAFATPAYASPQVLEGATPTVADDVYSLGCVAFELLSGVHPFGRVDAREARAQGMRPDIGASLPDAQRAALEAALSFDPARRPPDMQAFIALLGAAEADAAAATPAPARAPESVAVPPRRAGLSRGGWIAAGVVLAGLGAALLLRDAGPPPAPAVEPLPVSAPLEPSPAVVPDQAVAGTTGLADAPAEGAAGEAGPLFTPAATPQLPVPRAAMQRVGFERETLLVSRSAPTAAIPVRRTGGSTGRARMNWRIEEGSARSGRDFAPPLSGTLVLADGQERATVFVPLLDAGRDADDRGFSLVIERVGGAAGKGAVDRIDVTLHSFVRAAPRSPSARD